MSGAPGLAPGLARKVKKVLEIKADSPDLVEAIETLSQLYHENTHASRRALRSAAERRGLEISETFIGAAESVIEALNTVSDSLEGLSSSCNKIFTNLSEAKASTVQLSSETERLTAESEAIALKVKTVKDFLQQYQVTDEEVAALHSEDASDAFFSALAHVRSIHDNCRGLLRTQHHRAGLELMELMAHYQETAYERLCRWIQNECRNMGDLDAPDVSGSLQKAIAALQDRPVLFKYCIEEVATARHNALFQRFIAALTRGGPGGMPRPIEMHAHDPQRYVADMLAWVHQALADEREFVSALFGGEGSAGSVTNGKKDAIGDMDGHGGDLLNSAALLDRIFDSICRPLRVRIEQVLLSSLAPLLHFQLSQLHGFYLTLVSRVLGPSAQLVQALKSCRDMARRTFMEQMKAKADKLVRSPVQPPKDLSAPPQVMEAVHDMLQIVDAHETAMQASAPAAASPDQSSTDATSSGREGNSTSTTSPSNTEEELQPVLNMLVEALLEACQRSAQLLQQEQTGRAAAEAAQARGNLPIPAAKEVYLLNCLSSAVAACGNRRGAAYAAAELGRAADLHARALINGEVMVILSKVGCADLLDRLRLYQMQANGNDSLLTASGGGGQSEGLSGEASSDPSLAYTRIVDALRAFFTTLSTPDALPEFQLVQVPRVRSQIVSQFNSGLAAAYEALYTALDDPRLGYTAAGGSAGVRNSPDQVKTILGIA